MHSILIHRPTISSPPTLLPTCPSIAAATRHRPLLPPSPSIAAVTHHRPLLPPNPSSLSLPPSPFPWPPPLPLTTSLILPNPQQSEIIAQKYVSASPYQCPILPETKSPNFKIPKFRCSIVYISAPYHRPLISAVRCCYWRQEKPQSSIESCCWRGPNPPSEVAAGEAPIIHAGDLPASVSGGCWEPACTLHIPSTLAETGYRVAGPKVNVHGGSTTLDSLVDLLHSSVTTSPHPQLSTTDTITSETVVVTQNQDHVINEVLRPDRNIDDEHLEPAAAYPKPQRITRRPSKYVSPFKGDPLRTRVPMKKAHAVRKKFHPNLKSLNEVVISTGYIEFTGSEILGSFADDQELSPKFMSYFLECFSHDESVHMPDGGGYRVFLSHRIGEFVNMEDDEEYSQWDEHIALEILESDIADVDTTNVKLFFLPIMEQYHYSVYCINLIHDRIDILDSSPADHRHYHDVVGNRVIPRLNCLFQMATDGKLKQFTRFKRPILPVPLQSNDTDSGFFAIKYMELWNGESFHLPILTENASMYREQLLYYAIYHQLNTIAKLPAGLEAHKRRR